MRVAIYVSIILPATVVSLVNAAPALADGACCTTSGCEPVTDEAACSALGGLFRPGESCEDDACGVGACCSPDSCVEAEAYPCFMGGRDYMGVGTTCLDDACEIGIGACCDAGAAGASLMLALMLGFTAARRSRRRESGRKMVTGHAGV